MSKSNLLKIILISITIAFPAAILGLFAAYTGKGMDAGLAWQHLQSMDNFGILFSKMYAVMFLAILIGASLFSIWGTDGAARPKPARKPARPTTTGGGEREQGEVKWFNGKKGYGFIRRDNGDEVFVHYREIRGQGRRVLREGQLVEFTVGASQKGVEAQDVEILD
jgi:CspA family cold shock protein